MTAEQLIEKFNNDFGINPWPKTYGVDEATYASCCQYVFDMASEFMVNGATKISLGPSNGLLFKNVELIVKKAVYEEVKCPECNGPMKSRQGQYGTFWGCSAYPNCRGTRDNMGRSKAEREEEKSKPREPGRWNVT